MRKTMTLIFTVLAATVLLLAGCDPILPSGGKSVKFTAYSKSQLTTKTVYAGNYDATGSTHEDIYWEDGNAIRIYSGNPAVVAPPVIVDNQVCANYKLVVSSDRTKASLQNPEESPNGLMWVEPGAVDFYAVYPPTTRGSEYGWFTMNIPAEQFFKIPTKTDMSYAYMLAKNTLTAEEFNSEVSLDFYPAFTAFQINLKSKDDELTLMKFRIYSTDNHLAGDYYGKLKSVTNDGVPVMDFINNTEGTLENQVYVDFPYYETETETQKNTKISPSSEVNFTLLTIPCGFVSNGSTVSYDQYLTNLWLEVTYMRNGVQEKKKLALKQNDEFIQFPACKKYRINGLAVGDSWILDIDGKVLPWNGHDEKVKAQVTLQGKVSISGAIENTYVWQSTVGKELDARHRVIDNHYETDGTYSQFYQVRTLNTFNEIAAADRYFLMTFTPTAPTGGYWELVPTFKDGDTESRNHFKFELEERPNAGFKSVEMDELNGPILNSIVKIKIIPKNYDWSDPNTYNIWFKYYCRTSKTSAPISGDSEFQDVHGDGRFSYWTFRLGQYEGDFDPSIQAPASGN